MTEFTPISGVIGGATIGLAAALLMLLNGRIAGISGIFGDLLLPRTGFTDWRIAFLAGLIAAPLLYALAGMLGGFTLPMPTMPRWGLVVLSGLLVGFGVRLGGGCTSGHGVCGIARLSRRSIVATAVFMVAAAAVVYAMRHGIGG